MRNATQSWAAGLCLAAGIAIAPAVSGAADTSYLQEVERTVASLIDPSGDKDTHTHSHMPPGTTLAGVEIEDGHITVYVELEDTFLNEQMDQFFADHIAKHFAYAVEELGEPFSLDLRARPAGEKEAGFRPLWDFLPDPGPPVTKEEQFGLEPEDAAEPKAAMAPRFGQAQPGGALSGKSVFLSPGHGWYWNGGLGRWATQRGNTHQVIEDHGTGEAVFNWLQQYLWNAGAGVYAARERDLNTNMVVVSHGDAGYEETGSWSTQTASGSYDGSQRVASVSQTETATATFTPDIPEAGYYHVYAWYRRSTGGTGDTSTATRFIVNHAGGETEWVQNQNHDGFTWKNIGQYYFEEGSNPETGSVTVSNQGDETGRVVIADTFRFGGGMGDYPEGSNNVVSGKPRWEESGKYYAGFLGHTYGNGTVNAMPRWANWEHESWQAGNSVYVSWHTNAFNGTVRGTETYAYSSQGWGGAFDGVPGGDLLRDRIQQQLIADIRAQWDSGWTNRGSRTANFGEINPNNNPAMPGALTEIAFHDNAQDAAAIRDPRFRRIAARAVYRGVVRYFAEQDGVDPVFLPETPTHLRAWAESDGIQIEWNTPPSSSGLGPHGHAATGYRVYISEHPYAFADAIETGSTSFLWDEDLEDGRTYYLRVSATNDGGESFPTETLAVRYNSDGGNPILIVHGFDRLDESMIIRKPDPHSSNPQAREFLDRINTYDYVTDAARAVEAYGEYFDSAHRRAVEQNAISLQGYDTVIWLGGLENEEFNSISGVGQARIQNFLDDGGNIFISGAELATHLDAEQGGRDFYRDYLKARHEAQDAGTRTIEPAAGSIFEGIGTITVDDGSLIYNVATPDHIETEGGSLAAMHYPPVKGDLIDGFEEIGGWRQPGFSGQTNADGDSSFSIASSPVRSGSGSGHLHYVWGGGDFIRQFNQSQPEFPAESDFSIWVYGDGSGHQVRINLRDAADNDLFVTDWLTIDFTGWQEIVWEDVANNPQNLWIQVGNGEFDGPNAIFDSIHVQKVTDQNSGDLYFDDATYTLPETDDPESAVAGIQYSGDHQVVTLAFPWEAVTDPEARQSIMNRVLDFFGHDDVEVEDSWLLF